MLFDTRYIEAGSYNKIRSEGLSKTIESKVVCRKHKLDDVFQKNASIHEADQSFKQISASIQQRVTSARVYVPSAIIIIILIF